MLFHLVVSALLWIPVFGFFLTMAIDANELRGYFYVLASLLIVAVYVFKRAQLKVRFPALEVTAQHVVMNRPLYNRVVYDLGEVKRPKFVLNVLFFRHMGWPVFTSFPKMPKDTQVELMALLEKTN